MHVTGALMKTDFSSKKYIYLLLAALVAIFLGFNFIYKELASSFLIFILYFIIFIFFPAQFFSKKFIPIKLSRIESFVFGYVITEAMIFIFQWVFNFIGFRFGIWSFLIFTFLGIKTFLTSTRDNSLKETSSLEFKLSLFYVSFILLLFIAYFLIEIPAFEPGRITAVYQDQLWNVGNTWSVIRGIFPTIDSRFSGQILGYHLIQSYIHATFSIVSGIHPLLIQNYYFAVSDGFMMIFTIGLAARRFLSWSEKTIIRVLFILMLTKGLGWYYHGHLYSNPLTFFHSLSALFLFLITMIAYLKNKNADLFPVIVFSFLVMAGSKATLAMLFLPVLLLIFCYKLILKKDSALNLKREFSLGLIFLIVAIGLKFMIFLNSRPMLINQGGDYSTFFNLLTHHFPELSFGLKNSIFLFYLVIKRSVNYITNAQGVLFIFGISFLTSKGKLKQFFNEQVLFLTLSMVICIIFENVFRYDGSDGEIYFYWYGLLIMIFLFGHLHDHFELLSLFPKKLNLISFPIIAIGFVLFVNTLAQKAPWQNWLKSDSREHIEATVTYQEYQSLNWLRNNAKDTEIILSDRRSFPKDKEEPNGRIVDRFFAYSALSGKQFFVEGDSFNCCEDLVRSRANWNKVYRFINSSDNEERSILLKSFNVNYFIQSLRFNKKDFTSIPLLTLVYSNPDIKIYKVKRN